MDSHQGRFIQQATYLYGCMAVIDPWVVSAQARLAIAGKVAAWVPEVPPDEVRKLTEAVLNTVNEDVKVDGSVLFGAPKFVESCMGLSRFVGPIGRSMIMRDLVELAVLDGKVTLPEVAFLRALERAWRTGTVIPEAGSLRPAVPAAAASVPAVAAAPVVPVAERRREEGAAVAASAFGGVTAELPLPQAWWLEHLGSISDSTVEKGAAVTPASRTGRHQRLWAEANAWIDQLIASVFGTGRVRWVNRPNQYQIGRLSYTYWARIHPEDTSEFGDLFHIGLQVSKRLKWVDKAEPELAPLLDQPVLTLWASTNDRLIEKLGRPGLHDLYGSVQKQALMSQPALWAHGGSLVRVGGRLYPAASFVRDADAGRLPPESSSPVSLFSPLFTAEQVQREPARVSQMVTAYMRILAEPVLAGRAAAQEFVAGHAPAATASASPASSRAKSLSVASATVKGPSPSQTGSDDVDVPEALNGFAERVRENGEADVSLRELLGWFDAKRRGSRVMERVTAALKSVALGTDGALPLADMDAVLRFYADGRSPDSYPAEIAAQKDAAVAAIMNALGFGSPPSASSDVASRGDSRTLAERAAAYRRDWWGRSETYDKKSWQVAVPSNLDEITAAAKRLTAAEVDAITSRIRRHKVIPSMSFFPTRDGMKDTWWFHPFITVDERISSWVAVDKNGCNSAFDGNNDSSLSIPFGDVESHELEQIEDCLWRLNIETEDSIWKPISLDEYVPEGAGPYLKMLDAMLDVYMPVINASRGKPFWLHGAGGEGYQMFDSWEELLRDDGKWETAHRPKMGTVGEVLME